MVLHETIRMKGLDLIPDIWSSFPISCTNIVLEIFKFLANSFRTFWVELKLNALASPLKHISQFENNSLAAPDNLIFENASSTLTFTISKI